VDESKLSRVLTVCSRTYAQNSASPNHGTGTTHRANYVQGMNVLVAPFLYLMPEVDAYTAFMTLIGRHCPRYVVSNLDGVHHGCSLVDRVLEILDPILHRHITEKILRPEIFAFPYIMTLLANMSPLPEVIRLWDAIFAFGIHFDILLVTGQLMLMRDALLAEQQAFRSCLPVFPVLPPSRELQDPEDDRPGASRQRTARRVRPSDGEVCPFLDVRGAHLPPSRKASRCLASALSVCFPRLLLV
jgi:hypothetical protein